MNALARKPLPGIPRLSALEPRPCLLSRPAVCGSAEVLVSSAGLVEIMRLVLARGMPFRFKARGFSMSPFIRDCDVLTVVPLNAAPPGNGDVLAYVSSEHERLVVHRMVGRRDDLLLIQGDNQPRAKPGTPAPAAFAPPSPDWPDAGTGAAELVPWANLLGRVVRVERNDRVVRFGLGVERRVIAFLSRKHLLSALVTTALALRGRRPAPGDRGRGDADR